MNCSKKLLAQQTIIADGDAYCFNQKDELCQPEDSKPVKASQPLKSTK